jgi:hypothetical protein
MEQSKFESEDIEKIHDILPLFDRYINAGANIVYYCCYAA